MTAITSNSGMYLPSDLWLDQTDAEQQIKARLKAGKFNARQAEQLLSFTRDGYIVIKGAIDHATCDSVQEGVDSLWEELPHDLLYAYQSGPNSMSVASPERDRQHGYRLHDLHSQIPSALEVYLNTQLHQLMRLILGESAVAIQSLFFEYGSEQILHRDPVVIPMGNPSHLAAAWVALEDISPGSGNLVYFPGSHRLPYFEFAPGQYMFDSAKMGREHLDAGFAFENKTCEQNQLQAKKFTCKKGDVFIWHAGLRHGGSPIIDRSLTRKSMVVHFSKRSTYSRHAITVDALNGPSDTSKNVTVYATSDLVSLNGAYGFANPMQEK